MHSVSFRAILLAGSASAVLAAAGPVRAQSAEAIAFDIPSQPLGAALTQFAQQSKIEILFSSQLARDQRAPAVQGHMPPGQALAMLLGQSGLSYRETPAGSFVIEAADPQSGSAAGDGADSGTVQALIVTAQKREEDIQDVPIAISAFTQEDLTRSQVAGGPDLMTQVPNFTFTKTNFSSYSIQIRGIGTQAISATTDAAVAVAFNNTPFIRNRFFEQEFYDLERVEVLRGPQGTLYGRNATAGVVNIISAKPTFHYEAKLSGDVGNYDSTRVEGMINLPLVEDKVALRLAGAWTKRQGYSTNQITGNPIDGRDLWSTRLSLRVEPVDGIHANLIWEHFQENDDRLRSGKQLCHQDDRATIQGYNVPPINGYSALFSQGCLPASLYSPDSYEAPNGLSLPYYLPLSGLSLPVIPGFNPYASLTQSSDLRVIESTVDPNYRANTDVVELQWSADLGQALTLTSETAYSSDFIFSTQDFNRFNTARGAFKDSQFRFGGERENLLTSGPFGGIFCDPQVGCADRVVAVDLSTARSRHFSQEFRVSSSFDGPFNFSLGANFLRYDTEDKYYVFINTLTLYAAIAQYMGFTGLQTQGPISPWQPGVTDNRECMLRGLVAPDPTVFNTMVGCVYIDPNPIGSLNDQGHNYFLSRNPYKLISYAVFGESYYNISPTLKLTAGLRWTVDKKEAPRIPSWVLAADTAGYPVSAVEDQQWREPTGRLALDWKPDLGFTDETLLYASFAHGYKAGGSNPPPTGTVAYSDKTIAATVADQTAAKPKTFEPEFVNAYEIGAKNTLLDGRLTLNGTAFYYDYTGYQISQIIDRSAVNYNFDSKIWGLELESDWRPLENLRLGLKLGYEKTRVADGSRAIDIMDRTAGHEGWVVVRPFPSFTSNCILPTYVVSQGTNTLNNNQNTYVNGNMGYCEFAYVLNHDPLTNLDYNPDDHITGDFGHSGYPGYPGFDPQDESQGHNHGEGFFKDLSGHELPNAPHLTATITADYTLPLPHDWLMTLHTDLYYQSEAWTRIFNTPGYDKLKAYNNVNFAAIFSNEDAGWRVMAYVKNVLDRDSITGAFLNSDDTGLTTNVFLTEPRLYGLRVTKSWTGEGWWTGANPSHTPGEPYPLTVELGGMIEREDAPYKPLTPSFLPAFPQSLQPNGLQNRDLDWGDEREVRLTYRPGGDWAISGFARFGRINGGNARLHADQTSVGGCAIPGYFGSILCPKYKDTLTLYPTVHDWSDATVRNREDHTIAAFEVGKDIGIGGLDRSTMGLGLRYARLNSSTNVWMDGVPDWDVPTGWFYSSKYPSTNHRYEATLNAQRRFTGAGPTLTWDAAKRLVGDEQLGHVDVDWSVTGGVLFGRQKTSITGSERAAFFSGGYYEDPRTPTTVDITPIDIHRNKTVTAPAVDLSLGLSYEVQRFKASAGYRWERYFNVLDAGYAQEKKYDRTIDGPYFKLAVGFGG